jgi:hypothetical protein
MVNAADVTAHVLSAEAANRSTSPRQPASESRRGFIRSRRVVGARSLSVEVICFEHHWRARAEALWQAVEPGPARPPIELMSKRLDVGSERPQTERMKATRLPAVMKPVGVSEALRRP